MIVTSSYRSSLLSNAGGRAPTRGTTQARRHSCAIADTCAPKPPRLADALTPPRSPSPLRPGVEPDFLSRLMREHAVAWARLATADAIAEHVVRSLTSATGATLLLARSETNAGLERRIRVAAVGAGVVGARLDRLVVGVRRGIAAVVIDATLHGPVARALAHGLTLRNTDLELSGDPHARRQMRDNDVLIHTLSQPSGARLRDHADIYRVDPALTRAFIATEAIGLAPELFPFDGLSSSPGPSFAVEAVMAELATVRPAGDEIRLSLRDAARAVRDAPPDALELLEPGRRAP